MDFTFIDALTHSTDETFSKFQAQISKFSGTDFCSPSRSMPVGTECLPLVYGEHVEREP